MNGDNIKHKIHSIKDLADKGTRSPELAFLLHSVFGTGISHKKNSEMRLRIVDKCPALSDHSQQATAYGNNKPFKMSTPLQVGSFVKSLKLNFLN